MEKIIEKPNGNVIIYRKDGVHVLVNPGGYGFFLETEVPDTKAKAKAKPKTEDKVEPEPPTPKKGLVA